MAMPTRAVQDCGLRTAAEAVICVLEKAVFVNEAGERRAQGQAQGHGHV